MKKLIVVSAIVGMATLAHSAGVYIPQGERESLGFAPLAEGELCWLPNTATEKDDEGNSKEVIKSVTLYLGNGTVDSYRVLDPGALRGTVTKTLSGTEFSIGTDPYFTTTGNGTYRTTHQVTTEEGTNTYTGVGGTIYINVSSKYVIDHVTYSTSYPSGLGDMHSVSFHNEYSGNSCTITIENKDNASWAEISNIGVVVREMGEKSYVNNLMERTWLLKDQYGQFDFANLRYWTTHLYDGNRGEHWANYKATSAVHLDNNKLYFDSTNSAVTMAYKDKKLNIAMWGINMMQMIEGTSADVYDGTLEITAVNKQDSTYQLTYLQAITKNGSAHFDPTQLLVKYAPQLEANKNGDIDWEYLINGQDYTVTDYGNGTGVVDIPYNIRHDKGFYRLVYKGVLSNILRIEYNVPVFFNSGFYLKAPNGNYWKIKVDNSGNLSTEAM